MESVCRDLKLPAKSNRVDLGVRMGLPKCLPDGIIVMICALDKVALGTANGDTLLYGVEVKLYNMEVEVNEKPESRKLGTYQWNRSFCTVSVLACGDFYW